MKDALLLLFGGFVGFDLAIGYSWWMLRRANRRDGIIARIKPYVGQRRWPW